MALKVKRTGSDEFGHHIKMLVCGEPGAGKTKTGATWPNPLYVNAEGGLLSIQDEDFPTVEVEGTATLEELKRELQQPANIREKTFGSAVDTIVMDTFDEISRIFIKERMESTGKDTMAIQDWGWLGEQLRAVVRNYRNLPLNVILNCHLKSVTDEETGKMFLKPAIQGAVGDELAGYVDLAVVLTARPVTEVVGGKNVRRIVRVMQTFPDSRMPWVKDRSGKLPMEFEINFKDDFKRLDALVFGSVRAAAVQETVVPPAKEEAVIDVREPASLPAETKPAPKAAKQATSKTAAAKAEPEPQPEPEVEPSAPAEIRPEPAGEAEPVAETPAEEAAVEIVSEPETPTAAEPQDPCADCGSQIHKKEQGDLSYIRFRKRLCKSCMDAARQKK